MTALHGFLGLGSDWDAVLPESRFGVVQKPNWMRDLAELPGGEATSGLCQLAEHLNANRGDGLQDVLIGYSMGGRLAMHMLAQDASAACWNKAIIISASPGIVEREERRRRWDQDRRWAERFRIEAWDGLMRAWEAQGVFAGEPSLSRTEDQFDRNELATTLLRCSVGTQDDLRPALARIQVPVLWVAGGRDSKYAALAQECSTLNPRFQLAILPEAGHRVPWSAIQPFQEAVEGFLAGKTLHR